MLLFVMLMDTLVRDLSTMPQLCLHSCLSSDTLACSHRIAVSYHSSPPSWQPNLQQGTQRGILMGLDVVCWVGLQPGGQRGDCHVGFGTGGRATPDQIFNGSQHHEPLFQLLAGHHVESCVWQTQLAARHVPLCAPDASVPSTGGEAINTT
jgi:hypothetical protein